MSAAGFRPLRAAALAAALFSFAGLLHSAWIPLKAGLAQMLIEWSWRRELAGDPAPPWPWADTRALAVLEVPRLRERLVVLEGQSGRNLAFGPVMLDATQPGGDTVISGHRDTHLRFLQNLEPGDRLSLRDRRIARHYEVRTVDVIDSRRVDLVLDPGTDRLSLVTCFPFDAAAARGPLRYVVTAYPVSPRSPASG